MPPKFVRFFVCSAQAVTYSELWKFKPWGKRTGMTQSAMRKWQCILCAFAYDEVAGLPEENIAPGTRWEDVPADWSCPDCGAVKGDFDPIEA